MISWMWLIPAFSFGATMGIVIMAVVISGDSGDD